MKNFVAIAAPSGSGKTTLCRGLQKQNPEIEFSISVTTRPRRDYERNGYDYYFVSDDEFQRMIRKGELLEFEEVHGYYYGTRRASLEDTI
ncbi:MAG: guanylate kinase, partial [Fidelibacterota bacterium]